MIYLAIGILAGIAILVARARQNVKLRGDKPTLSSVADQMEVDVHNRKIDRANRKAALRAARYARRHPGKVARGQINH